MEIVNGRRNEFHIVVTWGISCVALQLLQTALMLSCFISFVERRDPRQSNFKLIHISIHVEYREYYFFQFVEWMMLLYFTLEILPTKIRTIMVELIESQK